MHQEYDLNDPLGKDRENIPAEFKTDEWWKKWGFDASNVFIGPNTIKQHDCESLSAALENDTPIFFHDIATNTYTISTPDYLLKGRKWPHYTLIFCPWCGGKL